MKTENREKHLARGKVTLYVSVYGDGALLDCSFRGPDRLKRDNEACGDCEACHEEEECTSNNTAIIRLDNVPSPIALRAWDYCREDNMGAEPYSDGYEATECLGAAESSEVIACSVPWTKADCERLGGCFLCGGMHDSD